MTRRVGNKISVFRSRIIPLTASRYGRSTGDLAPYGGLCAPHRVTTLHAPREQLRQSSFRPCPFLPGQHCLLLLLMDSAHPEVRALTERGVMDHEAISPPRPSLREQSGSVLELSTTLALSSEAATSNPSAFPSRGVPSRSQGLAAYCSGTSGVPSLRSPLAGRCRAVWGSPSFGKFVLDKSLSTVNNFVD